ncbi:MAG: hypothetical protein US40_C0001G0029 [Candidatus Roizmanbacteria bacterium GW2011_GWC2_37_13]|uniref:CDP-alcohol phosphatidyltransferase n=1 Tax=Candidatus Roizmanbacteria bacterium GW2011_GWC2_37_13 TaxID=1618486 RepID=A0A0G0GKK8_9BACT|nr:MAG: hypothetical protein US38_C0002G0029 [Candidatus Roizmanbacteria bacterium GW2011_GWC1_37_12]KKQ26680.1 MAG: hypothetical protein US40_C0001G0029 [Candidatus Roizmanbacteria bacterium GW2011_GWC2_37_13]
MRYLYILIIFLRILFALLIFRLPQLSVIVSFFLDVVDGDFAPSAITKKQYQFVDKTVDFFVYIFEMIYAWINFRDFRLFLLALLLWRFIGMVVFYITKNRRYFIIFGNYFENAFYVIFFNFIVINFVFTLITVFAFKLFQEWFIHVADLSVREDIFKKKRNWKK